MRVITQNLLGRNQDWPRRRTVLAAGLAQAPPDLVLFQEAVLVGGYDQAADLLGPDFRVAHHTERASDGSGIAVASRWPLGEVSEIDLRLASRPADFPAGVLAVDIEWPHSATPLLAVNHKPSGPGEAEREAQVVAAVRFVSQIIERTGQSVLLGGDFAAGPESPSVRFWSESYTDVWRQCNGADPGATFAPSLNALAESGGGDRRIDYLFTRKGDFGPALPASRCERLNTVPVQGLWGSDHFGLMAEFEVDSG
jgi:endonuclease/exonuclease/phosphatase (EEP) superfamily protein YafD